MPNPFAQANTPQQPSPQQSAVSNQPSAQPSGNPFAQVQPKKKNDQSPAAPSSVAMPAAGQQPEQLPDGAVGLDANGQPMFGDGLGGILKKWAYNFNKDVKPVDPAEWDSIKARWSQSMQQQGQLNPDVTQQTPEQKAATREQLGVAVEAATQ